MALFLAFGENAWTKLSRNDPRRTPFLLCQSARGGKRGRAANCRCLGTCTLGVPKRFGSAGAGLVFVPGFTNLSSIPSADRSFVSQAPTARGVHTLRAPRVKGGVCGQRSALPPVEANSKHWQVMVEGCAAEGEQVCRPMRAQLC